MIELSRKSYVKTDIRRLYSITACTFQKAGVLTLGPTGLPGKLYASLILRFHQTNKSKFLGAEPRHQYF